MARRTTYGLYGWFLPSAYVVRREGNVLTRVCLSVHRGGQSADSVGGRGQSSQGGGQFSRGSGGSVQLGRSVQPGAGRVSPAVGGGQGVSPVGGGGQSSRGGSVSQWGGQP